MICLLFCLLVLSPVRAATIEFLTGEKLECKVLTRDDKEMKVEITKDGKTTERTIPLTEVHVVTINSKRYVINPKLTTKTAKTGKTTAKTPVITDSGDKGVTRTKAEIDALIDDQGRTPPDWFEETPLNFPKSLDLSWPPKPPPGWDNQKNVGQYIWDVINPNQNKWREGIKLMHHLLTLHKDDEEKRTRAMTELGRMYFTLHEDYPRAAFWWRKAGLETKSNTPGNTIHLAECYLRLGNKQMALDLLKKAPGTFGTIKLYAELGDLPAALKLAEAYARGGVPDMAYLTAGDACRAAGKFPQAVTYYEKVLAVKPDEKTKGRIERTQRRAQANLDAVKLFELSDPAKVPDGTYEAESLGYEANVRIQVAVRGGKITSVKVTQHREKQYYSSISDTAAKIISKNGVKGVDATSGATITSEAIINATAKALSAAAK
ncbi:MAG: FMN-binding protein [Planctomycetales bacterium]|nr:FMN-binding protein [Planctomycetales bacterium]